MSGTLPPAGSGPDDQELDLLAAEYVLGTLDSADHAALTREAETDTVLRDAIHGWENRLAPLVMFGEPATPPADLWPRIEGAISALATGSASLRPSSPGPTGPPRPSSIVELRPRAAVRLWQGTAAIGFALAAAIAGFAVLRPAPTPAPRLITALVPLAQPSQVFVAEATADGGLSVKPVGTLAIAADRDLELWLLKDGQTVPTPLGVLPAAGVQLAAGSVPAGGGAKILISLEPRGGSPTGLPTGPVLYGGAI